MTLQMKFVELERVRSEMQEKMLKLQQESDVLAQQLEDAETKASAAIKSASTIESQLSESQQLLEEETRQKLALSSKLRQLESEREAIQEQLEEDEEQKKNYEKKMAELTFAMQEMKKKADEEGKFQVMIMSRRPTNLESLFRRHCQGTGRVQEETQQGRRSTSTSNPRTDRCQRSSRQEQKETPIGAGRCHH